MEDIHASVNLYSEHLKLELDVKNDLTPDLDFDKWDFAGAILSNWDEKFIADNSYWVFTCTKQEFKESFNEVSTYQKGLWTEVKALRARAKELKLVR